MAAIIRKTAGVWLDADCMRCENGRRLLLQRVPGAAAREADGVARQAERQQAGQENTSQMQLAPEGLRIRGSSATDAPSEA
jgi:hypothetical protein